MEEFNHETYLALDVGGSSIKYALISGRFNNFRKIQCPNTNGYNGSFVETIGTIYDQYKDRVEGMAISMPGIINPEIGYAFTGGALRYIDKMNIVDILKKDVQSI